ncbi:hypothetical protein [Mycobacteroides abscessus]|uniref:phage tail termination protein n=1 Tax=Mycobacteroides abscessus TaxID=36809 RepID=UPI0005B35D53|nr:hypothetical protein [Mycobacteroides abscessus]
MSLIPDWLPDWWEDNYVDQERLLIGLFEQLLPDVTCGRWKSDDYLDEQGRPVDIAVPELWFWRQPGGVEDYQRGHDIGVIEVTAVSGHPDYSNRLQDFVRSILIPIEGQKVKMEDGFVATIQCVEGLTGGPQMSLPGQRIDERISTYLYKITVGLRSRKRYGDKLRELL